MAIDHVGHRFFANKRFLVADPPETYREYLRVVRPDVYKNLAGDIGQNWKENWAMFQSDLERYWIPAVNFNEKYMLWLLTR